MIVNEVFEAYTMTLGFFLNNRIWELMLSTGVAYIPILITIVKSVSDAYQGGDDEGDRGSVALRHIEIGIARIFFVMVFCLFPTGTTMTAQSVAYNNSTCNLTYFDDTFRNLNTMHPDTSQLVSHKPVILNGYDVPISNVDFKQGLDISVNGLSPTPSMWLQFIQNLSSKATNAVTATMPCETDISGVAIAIGEIKSKTYDMDLFLNHFVEQCYQPSLKAELIKSANFREDANGYLWLGSDVFRAASKEYDSRRMTLEPEYWVETVTKFRNSVWNYEPRNDIAIKEQSNASPTCSTGYIVLEKFAERDFEKEIADLNSDYVGIAWTSLSNLYQDWVVEGATSSTRGLDTVIKRLASASTSQQFSDFQSTNDKSVDWGPSGEGGAGILAEKLDIAKGVGLMAGWFSASIDASFASMLANPTIAIVQCLIFMMIPILLLLSNYSMKILGMLTVTIFGLEFTHVIFEICKWLDNTMIKLLSSPYSTLSMQGEHSKYALYNAVNMSYTLLPLIWFALLGTVGFAASTALGSSMGSQAKGVSGSAKGTAKTVASKGKG